MKKKSKIIIVLLIILVIGIICVINLFQGTKFKKVTISNNQSINYSSKMLNTLYDENTNILYSDLTINPILTFFYDLGNDKVKSEMNDYFNDKSTTLINNYEKIYDRYKEAYKRVNYSNSYWINKGKTISPKATKTAEKLNFPINEREFSKESTVNEINNWITKKSHGKVKGTLKQSEISNAHSVMVGTLYFNEKWQVKYKKEDINEGTFNGTKGNQKVIYLKSEEDIFLENSSAKGFMRPYKDEHLYFIGIIPQEGKDITDVDIEELMKTRRAEKVDVKIPEFEYEYERELNNDFQKLGLKSIYNSGSLNNISKDLYISKIIQKNYIRVDRKGTEAFSYSAVIGKEWAMEAGKNTVYLDQPFIFMIYDDSIEQVLFIGQVNNIK